MAAATSSEILQDFFPLMRVYKDGRIERPMGEAVSPASVDPETGVRSKDVQISPETNLSARLYLPKTADPAEKLPLLIYFHGGGFVAESAFSPMYQKHLNILVAEANVVALSLNYRLAPEHLLPAAYDDSWLALKWVAQNEENWIQEHADLGRVYFGGDSAGGNIAHNLAVRVGSENVAGVKLSGIYLNCPLFWGEDQIENEPSHDVVTHVKNLWRFVCPNTTGCDDPRVNPAKDPKLSGLGCKRVLVYAAEKDVLKARGWYYKEVLRKSGWDGEAEVVEVEGEDHVFSVINPTCENGITMLKKVASFLNH